MPRAQSVAEASNSFDEITGHSEFAAQTLHMHVDGACLDVRRGVPHRLEKIGTILHPSTPLGERQQQLVLGGSEIYLLVVHANAMLAPVDGYGTNSQHVGSRALRHATKNG